MSPYQAPVFAKRRERFAVRDEEGTPAQTGGLSEVQVLVALVSLVAVAYAFPFPAVKYLVIGIFGILMLMQTLQRPAMGLAMLAFGVPAIDLIPPDIIPIRGMNAETMLILVLFFIWARAKSLYGESLVRSRVGFALAVYSGLIIVSAFHSWLKWNMSLFDLLAAAKNHLSYMLFLPVAFHTLRSRRDQRLLLHTVSLALLLSFAQAIEGSWFSFLTGSLERNRATAVFAIQPNILGAAIAMYLPVFLMLGFNKIGSKGARVWFVACSGAGAFALLLTLSRGSWLALVFGLLVIALFKSPRLLLALVLLASTYQLWVPQQAIDRVMGTKEVSTTENADPDQIADGSTQMRIEQYKSLPGMMMPNPIMGWGYLSYPRVFETHGTLGRKKGAHSTYCLIGTEEGLVGLFVLFLVFGTQLLVAGRGAQLLEDPVDRWIAVGLVGGTLAMMVAMGSGSRFEAQKIFVFHWILFAIVERNTLMQLLPDKSKLGMFRPATEASSKSK